MSELQIAWLELGTVGGLGVLLALAGILVNIIIKRKNHLCTDKTTGVVINYGFLGEGRMYPIVEYSVNGNVYRAKKKFRGIKTKQVSGLPIAMQSKAYEDEKGWLYVTIGPVANLRQLAEQLWPIDSEMTVYYHPQDPRKCYVERPLSGSFAATMFVIMGLAVLMISVLLFVLIAG
jgi:hypothetical protein